ncbi:hypothetical protein C8R44DRAFT_589731, partial [Mycena epipterygia]
LVAGVLNWGLFGALSVQVYLYYQAFPNDRSATKWLVYIVYALELMQTIIVSHDTFATFGSGFGDVSALLDLHLTWFSVPVMSGLVAFIGQSFDAYRVFVLSKSYFTPVLIVIVRTFTFSHLGSFTMKCRSPSPAVWCGSSALCDVIIAFQLSKHDTEFRQTRVLVSKIIRLTIETGSLTGMQSSLQVFNTVTTVGLFFGFRDRYYYATLANIIPKLYTNSILIILNSRIQI